MSEIDREEVPDQSNDRNETLKLIDWFDIERVQSARMMVVGAGAIGNEVLKNLALLGIGNIFIIDRDTIETSNLSRSLLYRDTDVGKVKAETAAHALRDLNPGVKVAWRNGDLLFDIGLGLLRRMDVIIGCLDNRQARLILNRKSWKVGKPWIDAGIDVLDGQVSVYRPGYGGCYECSFTQESYHQAVLPCNRLMTIYAAKSRIPTTPTIASLVAAVQVQEALKLLQPEMWEERSLAGREFVFNGTVCYADIFERPMRQWCLSHSLISQDDIVELKGHTAQNTTGSQLLQIARELQGPNADIELNFDLVVECHCYKCGETVRELRPFERMVYEDLYCSTCSKEGKPVLRTPVLTNKLGRINPPYQEDFLDLHLASLGVAPLDILRVRGDDSDKHCYLELTGDARAVFFTDAKGSHSSLGD